MQTLQIPLKPNFNRLKQETTILLICDLHVLLKKYQRLHL